MAASVTISSDSTQQFSGLISIKSLSESGLTSIPSSFASKSPEDQPVTDLPESAIPVIDFSLLTSNNQEVMCKAIQDLGKACEEWGFFMLINHGIPQRLMKSMMEGVREFFNLPDEEKREFQGKDVTDPIRFGSSFNIAVEKVHCWRDFLKVSVHPEFHFPHKPSGLRETAVEYVRNIREVIEELLKGLSESLGLEADYISKAINHESSFQVFVANMYPPCPQPELAIGMPPHSDHCLLTIISENGISGFQTLHNGKWVKVNAPPNALLVNTADQLEILTNGRYKSNVHRAALYGNDTRISIANGYGPSLDKVINPAPELVDESNPPAFNPITYREFFAMHQSNSLDKKSTLDRIRIAS